MLDNFPPLPLFNKKTAKVDIAKWVKKYKKWLKTASDKDLSEIGRSLKLYVKYPIISQLPFQLEAQGIFAARVGEYSFCESARCPPDCRGNPACDADGNCPCIPYGGQTIK